MKSICHLSIFLVLIALFSCGSPGSKGKVGKEDSLRTAVAELTKKISASPEDGKLYEERAKLYLALKELNQALNDLNKALQISPRNADLYIVLSDLYLLMGQPQNCEEALQKAVSVDPSSIQANLKLANLYLIIKDYKKVDQYAREVLTLEKSNGPARFTRALASLEVGDTARAVGDLMDAVKYNQQYYEAYVLLGELYATRKDPLAAGYLNNALRIRPGSREALYMLGMFYQETGQYPKALGTYEVLSRADTTFRDAPYNMGYIQLVHIGDYPRAVECFTKAIQLDSQYAESWYNRGLSYEQLKDYKKAYSDYQKSLKLKVNYDKAIEGLNRLDKLMGKK
jgi:tetratricopeptide (TPR) repeat protein